MKIDYSSFNGEVTVVPQGATAVNPHTGFAANRGYADFYSSTPTPLLNAVEAAKFLGLTYDQLKGRRVRGKFPKHDGMVRGKYLWSRETLSSYKLREGL